MIIDSYRSAVGGLIPTGTEAYFASEYSSVAPLAGAAWGQAGFYEPSTNRTWIAWEGVVAAADSHRRVSCVSVYDHTSGEWLPQNFLASILGLIEDDHGRPVLVRDHEGHVHCFHGSHNSNQLYASTSVADDPTSFVQRSHISTGATYPHPHSIGSALYVLMRKQPSGNGYPLAIRSTSSLSSGVATWNTEKTLVLPQADNSRFYMGPTVQDDSGRIHISATIAPSADTYRRGVYYLIYDTDDGSLSNWNGSTVVEDGDLPVERAVLDADFRLVDQGSNYGEIPAFCLDNDGVPHVVYAESSETGGPFSLYHTYLSEGAWTTPELIGAGIHPNRNGSFVLVPNSEGVDLYHSSDPNDDWGRGGDIIKRSWNGTWGDPQTILQATDYACEVGTMILNAHDDLRIVMCEQAEDVEDDSLAGPMKVYAYGDSGFVQRGDYDPLFHMVQLLMSFDGDNNATSAPDDSDRAHTMTFSGNAKLDTSEKKFGTASLQLDGDGDWLQHGTIADWYMANFSFCIEGWIKTGAAIAKDQHLFSLWHLPSSDRGYLCSIDDDIGGQWNFRFLVTIVGSNLQTLVSTPIEAIDDQEWHHVAVERERNTVRLYVDGEVMDETTFTGAIDTPAGGLFRLGGPAQTAVSTLGFVGHLDEWRITRGWWRYGGAFTPPNAPFSRPT